MKAAVLYLCEGARIVEAASQACKPRDVPLLVLLVVMSSHKLYFTTKVGCHVQIDTKKKNKNKKSKFFLERTSSMYLLELRSPMSY